MKKLILFFILIYQIGFSQESINPYNIDIYNHFHIETDGHLVLKNKVKLCKAFVKGKLIIEENFNKKGYPSSSINLYQNKKHKSTFQYDSLGHLIKAISYNPTEKETYTITNNFKHGKLSLQNCIDFKRYSWRSKNEFIYKYEILYNTTKDSVALVISTSIYKESIDTTHNHPKKNYKDFIGLENQKEVIPETLICDTIKSMHALLLGGGCVSYAQPGDPVIKKHFKNGQIHKREFFDKNKLVNTTMFYYLENQLLDRVVVLNDEFEETNITHYVYDYYK